MGWKMSLLLAEKLVSFVRNSPKDRHLKAWGQNSCFLSIKNALNWSKMAVKSFIIIQKISISNKCGSFELSIHLWILKKKCVSVYTKILCSTTVFNINNNQKRFLSRKSAYYYDFWRSCDPEDWSNDAGNTEINNTLTHIHIENCFNVLYYFTIFAVFLT